MDRNVWRFLALMLAALALTTTGAHVLELPQKMQYGAALYSAVNTTMYLYFALVGGGYCMAAIVTAAVLTFLVRRERRQFRWALAGTVFLLLWFASWLGVVNPVNQRIGEALRTAHETVPALWLQLRPRWEYGHALGFVLQLLGLCSLVLSVLAAVPTHLEKATSAG